MQNLFARMRELLSPGLLVLILLGAAVVFAQNDLGTIRGTITDQSGAGVPRAHIVLKNIATGATRETDATEQGDFEIPFITQGTYELTASAQGFRKFVATDLVMRARELRRVDGRLEVGTVGSEVTVTAGIAVISTEGSQVAGGFNSRQFTDSALSQQTFFPQAYMATLPNVQTTQGNVSLRFAGQPASQIAQNMDGITNDGSNNLVQNMNDFEDLQVIAVNNSAEFSRVGQFTMVSKSGGNQFHGRVSYDLSNSALNARNPFSPTKVPFKEHRGVASLSGPIIRNRVFFYLGYSLVRIPAASYYLRDVPTERMRSGDFSDYLRLPNAVTLRDPLTGQPFPGNIIPADRINAVSQKTQDQFIPRPNRGSATSTFQNFGFTHPYPTDLYKWDGFAPRVDYVISSKNQLFGRFINRVTPYLLAGAFPNVGTWTRVRNSYSVVVNDTHTFSPRLVNSFQWGMSHDGIEDGSELEGFTPVRADKAIAAIGLQGVNPEGVSVMGFPTFNITGIQTLNSAVGGVNQNRTDHQFSNSTTYSVSKHVLKFGGVLRHFRDNPQGITADTFGNFTFNGSSTGIGYADFLLGIPFSATRATPITNRTQTAYELGFFVQDTYKVTPRLTLDVGFRWDYFRHSLYDDRLQYNFDPATRNVIVPEEALGRVSPLYPKTVNVVAGNPFPRPDPTNFQPRTGIAYRITDTFAVRGGYGQYTEALGNLYRAQGGGPFQVTQTYNNQISNGQPLLSFPNPFPSSVTLANVPSQSVTGYPADTENGVIRQFNVTLEKQFGSSFGTRLSYIGSRSSGLNYNLELNKPRPSTTPFAASRRPYPQFVSVVMAQNDGRAKYDALQFEIQKRAGDLILDAHYTLSNSMLDYANLQNPYDHYMWNRDAFNARNRFVLNATYQFPFGHGRKLMGNAPRLVDGALGGWQLGWITYLQSGQYFTPSFSGSDPSNTNTVGGLPDRIADGNLPRDERRPDRWFDPSAFRAPAPGTFGNSGVAILEGPGLHLHHLTLMKQFRVTERVNLVLQANASNLFNSSHYDWPNANISVASSVARVFQLRDANTGGREYSGPRQVQFRFRIEF